MAGKTCFAEAHSKSHCAYIIDTLDQLKSIPGECDLLVFDDMNFGPNGLDLTAEQMIKLLTIKRSCYIKCRHFDGRVPPLPRIFTTNLNVNMRHEYPFPWPKNTSQENAYKRRLRHEPWVEFKLYGPPGVKPSIEYEDSEDSDAGGEPGTLI